MNPILNDDLNRIIAQDISWEKLRDKRIMVTGASGMLGTYFVRTVLKSNAAKPVYATSILLSIIALIVPFTFLGKWIGLVGFSPIYLIVIIGFPILYCFIASIVKKLYIKRYGEWI